MDCGKIYKSLYVAYLQFTSKADKKSMKTVDTTLSDDTYHVPLLIYKEKFK